MPKIRYAQQPAIICPLTVPKRSRICPLPGFLRTRMSQHVDGYSYLLLHFITNTLRRLKPPPTYPRVSHPGARRARPSVNSHPKPLGNKQEERKL